MTEQSPIMTALRDQSATTPDATAILGPGGLSLSYAQTMARLAVIGDALTATGLQPAHRVATLLPDTIDTALGLLAMTSRLSVMPLNSALTDGELLALVTRGQVHALVAASCDRQAIRLASSADIPLVTLDNLAMQAPFIAPAQDQHQPGLVLLTSGSTGLPKMVRISPDAMLASARNIIKTLQLGPHDRALHALPMFHIGAVVDLLLVPLLSGGSTAICAGRMPPDLLDGVIRHETSWMQLVPTMLTHMLADLDAAQLNAMGQNLDFVRMVSADLSDDLQHEAEDALGVPLIQMYGMTETAGQICSNSRPPAERRAGSVGEIAGPEVAILDATGGKLPQGREGEVCVRGPTVFNGYEGHGKHEAFFNDWFRTGDLGRFDADGYLFLTGRKKEMINQGGEKISPLEIERAALALAGVTEAAAYPLPHPTLGEHTGLSVVTTLDEAQVMDHLKAQLAHYKLPRKIDLRDTLPRLGGGKVDKLSLIRAAQPDAPMPEAAWDGQALAVAKIWAETLNTDLPAAGTDFFDAGGDSLSATTFLVAVEEHLSAQIDPNILFNHPTFGGLIENLSLAQGLADGPSVLAHMRRLMAGWPGEPALDGGLFRSLGTASEGAAIFWCSNSGEEGLALQKELRFQHPVHLTVSTVHFPNRTEADRDIAAETLLDEVNAIQPDGPLVIGGFCEGVHLVERVARQLVAQGREVALFISGDHWLTRPTPFPVFHLYTQSPHFSRGAVFSRPNLAYRVMHPAGATHFLTNGAHLMWEEHLSGFGDAILPYLRGEAGFEPAAPPAVPYDQRHQLHDASLRLKMPRFGQPGTTFPVQATVTNRSQHIWEPTAQSGLAIAAHARNLDNWVRQYCIGLGEISSPVHPGETCKIRFDAIYPSVFLPLKIEVMFSDQGFQDMPRGSPAFASRFIWPRPF